MKVGKKKGKQQQQNSFKRNSKGTEKERLQTLPNMLHIMLETRKKKKIRVLKRKSIVCVLLHRQLVTEKGVRHEEDHLSLSI